MFFFLNFFIIRRFLAKFVNGFLHDILDGSLCHGIAFHHQ